MTRALDGGTLLRRICPRIFARNDNCRCDDKAIIDTIELQLRMIVEMQCLADR